MWESEVEEVVEEIGVKRLKEEAVFLACEGGRVASLLFSQRGLRSCKRVKDKGDSL